MLRGDVPCRVPCTAFPRPFAAFLDLSLPFFDLSLPFLDLSLPFPSQGLNGLNQRFEELRPLVHDYRLHDAQSLLDIAWRGNPARPYDPAFPRPSTAFPLTFPLPLSPPSLDHSTVRFTASRCNLVPGAAPTIIAHAANMDCYKTRWP